jgi:hypothetical protein
MVPGTMIITDRFVYIHMPKTGGTFVEAALQRLYSSQRQRGFRRLGLKARREVYIDTSLERDRRKLGVHDQHQTVREIPAAYRDRPIALTVRNPFDHLVSYYEFKWWKTHPGDTFDESRIRSRYAHYPEISFEEYVRACYDWHLIGFPEPLTRRLEAAGIGLLTYHYIQFLSPSQPDLVLDDPHSFFLGAGSVRTPLELRFLRQESLNRELYDFLRSVGHTPDSVRFILEMGRVLPKGGPRRMSSDWASYFTPDLQRLVRERESCLFSVFPDYS